MTAHNTNLPNTPGDPGATPEVGVTHVGRDSARNRRHITRDTAIGSRDKNLSPGDRDDRPTQQANESSYAAAPSAASRAPDGLTIELPQHDPVITPAIARALLRLVQRVAAGREQPDDQQHPPLGSSP